MVRFQQRFQDFAHIELMKSRETVAKNLEFALPAHQVFKVQTHKRNHNEAILLALKVQPTDR